MTAYGRANGNIGARRKNGSTEHAEDRTNCIPDDICHGPEPARHEYLVPLQQGTSGVGVAETSQTKTDSPRRAWPGATETSDDDNQDGQSQGKVDSEVDVHSGLCLRLKNRSVPFINPD